MPRRSSCPLFGLLCCWCVVLARADDWPQWRGPQRDGVWREDGIMEKFPTAGLKILWRAGAGGGWSSPVVADGRAFLIDSELIKPKARERVRCFDATTGKLLWTHAYEVDYPDWAFAPDQMGGPTSTSAVAEGAVYSLGANGALTCLAAANGEVIWSKDLMKEYGAESFKVRASPLIDGDLLILVVGGKPKASFVALDRKTGREVWRALEETITNSSPIIITAGGQRQLIVWTAEAITSLDPATGAVWWREAQATTSYDANDTPVWLDDYLLLSGLMFQLDAVKPGAKVIWPENRAATKRVLSNTSTPWLTTDAAYSATNKGDLVCLDPATGKELWHTDKVTDRKSGPSIHITPHGETAFLYTNLGELIHARLTRSGYEELSRTKLLTPVYMFSGRKISWSPAAYAHRCVFVRDEAEILCASLAAEAN
jgi:outer membrane protein assembly factor BamB